MNRTEVGISFCKGERYLKSSCSMSSILSIDVGLARDLVAQELTDVEGGLERVEHAGTLSKQNRIELRRCLGVIANGDCPFYPKTEN